ncbi:MAG: hypothetical protein WD402_08355 [Chloroflexota bacterium]
MTVAVVSRDLMIATRIADAGARAGVEVQRYDDPGQLPPASELTLVLVAWDERRPDWGEHLMAWSAAAAPSEAPRVVLFGPHTDLAAHAEARASGLGPMWARSKLLAEIKTLLG